jgi:hypothetical protein
MLGKVPTTELPPAVDYVDPADLVTLAELTTEGFGYDAPYVRTPKDAIDALARQLDGEVVTDDIGRRCINRDAARRLFTEGAEAEERARQIQERHQAEMAKIPHTVPRGIKPPEGMSAQEYMAMQMAADRQRERGASVFTQLLDDELAGRPSSGGTFKLDADGNPL